jgi:hypothetical protein
MKKSAKRLHEVIAASNLFTAANMGHGGICLSHPEQYVSLITDFFSQ